jgi:hypothetical protein
MKRGLLAHAGIATADRIADHNGRNPQERASLKKRLLRKWMSK